MYIPVIIQARMGAVRFPGKVLRCLNGKPIIECVIERIKRSRCVREFVVATSIAEEDDAITDYCKAKKVEFFRGALHNVAERFKDVIGKYGFNEFIRICADSPLIDTAIIDDGIKIFSSKRYEIVTNTLRRTFPKGQSFEILQSETFINGYKEMSQDDEFEHVTRYFYKNADKYKIYNMEVNGQNYSSINLSIDSKEDFDLISQVINNLGDSFLEYGWEGIVDIFLDIKNKKLSSHL